MCVSPPSADIMVTVAIQWHTPLFGVERMTEQWPDLMALHDRVMALPRIAAYKEGPLYIPTPHSQV